MKSFFHGYTSGKIFSETCDNSDQSKRSSFERYPVSCFLVQRTERSDGSWKENAESDDP